MILSSTGLPIGIVSAIANNNSLTLTGNAINQIIDNSYETIVSQNYFSPVIKTLGGNISVNGILTVNNLNLLADGGFTITSGKSGVLDINNGGYLEIGTAGIATAFPTSFKTYNLSSNSTVIYNSNLAQSIASQPVYGNLLVNSGIAITKTAAAAVVVAGNLTIGSNVTFADGGFGITVNGNLNNSGSSSSSGTGSIILSGGSSIHSIAGTGPYTNLTCNDENGAQMLTSININGAFTINNGIFYINNPLPEGSGNSSGNTLTLGGTSSIPTTSIATGLGGTINSILIAGTGTSGNLGTIGFATGTQNLESLQINKTNSGTVTLTSNLTLNSPLPEGSGNSAMGLNIISGLLVLGNNNLILGPGTTYSFTPTVSNMVVADQGSGKIMKTFPMSTNTSFTYPVGNMSGTAFYSPVLINNFNPAGANRTIGVNVTMATHPDMNNPNPQTNYLNRYWTLSDDGGTGGTSTGYTYGNGQPGLQFTYDTNPTDVTGTLSASNDQINRWDGSEWFQTGSPASGFTGSVAMAPGNYTNLNAALVDGTSFPSTNDYTVRNVAQQPYTWMVTTGKGDWNTPTNWKPNRYSPDVSDILKFNQGGSSTAINVPNQTIQEIIVDNSGGNGNTNITLQPSASNNTLTINGSETTGANIFNIASGSSMTVNNNGSNTLALTIIAGIGTTETVAGTLTDNSTTFTPAGTLYISGTYVHGFDGGTIPTATWTNQGTVTNWGTLNITGIISTNPGGFNQNFGYVIWNNPSQVVTSASGSLGGNITINGDLTVKAGTLNFNSGNNSYTVSMVGNNSTNSATAGNVINNSVINSAGGLLAMNGTNGAQSISGSGLWTTPIANSLNALTINNTSGVNLNCSFAVQTTLNLVAGPLTGSGTLTLGNGTTSSLTTTVTNGTIPLTGSTPLKIGTNFTNVIYQLTYNASAAPYTTGGELPGMLTLSQSPVGGNMFLNNPEGVTLGASGTIYSLYVYNNIGLLNLNGKTLQLVGNGANGYTIYNYTSIANTSGINAGTGSNTGTLSFIGNTLQSIWTGNQAFNNVNTAPNIIVSNTSINNGARLNNYQSSATWYVNNVTINSGSYFGITNYNFNLFITGNITNNGVIYVDGGLSNSMISLTGTNQQTISGNGNWALINTNAGSGTFTGLTIANTYWNGSTPAVFLNQNMGIQNTLNLTSGILGGSGTLTLGNGTSSTLTTNTLNGTWPVSGNNVLAGAYNLANMTYYLNYNTSSFAGTYYTGGELPAAGSVPPAYGNMNINTANAGGVTLGSNGTVYALQINNTAGSILHMNGFTLNLVGNGANNGGYSLFNAGNSANTTGLDASVAGSTLNFTGSTTQYIYYGNQVFEGVPTYLNIDVSNINSASCIVINGSSNTLSNLYIYNLNINNGASFGCLNNGITLNVEGNLTNNGTIYAQGGELNSGGPITLDMVGTTLQTISGTGTFAQTNYNAGSARFPALTINNTSGLNPGVMLNQSFALQNALTLTDGVLGGTGTLTESQGLQGNTFTMTRVMGAMTIANAFNLANTTFVANYGIGSSVPNITTGT